MHRVNMNTIAQLSRHATHMRTHRRHIYLHIFKFMTHRGPLSRQVTEIVVRAFVVQFFFTAKRAETGLYSANVITHLRRWLVECRAVSAHNMPAHLTAQPETEAATGVCRQFPGDLRGNHRTARKRHRDTSGKLQFGRRHRCRRDGHPGRGAGLRKKHARKTCALQILGELSALRPAHAANHHVKIHRYALPIYRSCIPGCWRFTSVAPSGSSQIHPALRRQPSSSH